MLQYSLYDLVTATTRKEPAEKQTSQTTNLYIWLKHGIGWQRDCVGQWLCLLAGKVKGVVKGSENLGLLAKRPRILDLFNGQNLSKTQTLGSWGFGIEAALSNTRGKTYRRILCWLSGNGWAELKILSPSIIPHLSSLKFGIVGLDRLSIG